MNLTRKVIVALAIVTLVTLAACAPNRNQVMSEAATRQASLATESIGDVPKVKDEARQGAEVLRTLAAAFVKKPPGGDQQGAISFAEYSGEISAGLQAIADSRTDAGFTNAVFAMCDPARKDAAPRVGRVMVAMAAGLRNKPSSNLNPEQQQALSNSFETFGERLINIPGQCEQASKAMAEASAQENQAEAEHQANVNRALVAAAVVFAGVVMYSSAVASRPTSTASSCTSSQRGSYWTTNCNPN